MNKTSDANRASLD